MKRQSTRTTRALLVGLTVVAAGCGGGGGGDDNNVSSDSPNTTPAPSNPPSSNPAPTPAPASPTPAPAPQPVPVPAPVPQPAPVPAPPAAPQPQLQGAYPTQDFECGVGRPLVHSFQRYKFGYNGGVIRLEPQTSGEARSLTFADPSSLVRQQHSGSATFSGAVTSYNETAWMSISLENQIIGGGKHGTSDDSHLFCGAALDGLERAGPLYRGYYDLSNASIALSCLNSQTGVRGSYETSGTLVIRPDQIDVVNAGYTASSIPDSATRNRLAQIEYNRRNYNINPNVNRTTQPSGRVTMKYQFSNVAGTPALTIEVDEKGNLSSLVYNRTSQDSVSCFPK